MAEEWRLVVHNERAGTDETIESSTVSLNDLLEKVAKNDPRYSNPEEEYQLQKYESGRWKEIR